MAYTTKDVLERVIQTADNKGYEGSAVVGVSSQGEIISLPPGYEASLSGICPPSIQIHLGQETESLESKYTDRFDNPRYYEGDTTA